MVQRVHRLPPSQCGSAVMTFLKSALLGSAAIMAVAAADPAVAQSNDAEVEALRAEVAALKAQLAYLSAKVEKVAAAPAPAPAAAPEKKADAKPATEIAFKGAPEFKNADGFSFKPRGRIQLDAASVNVSDPVATASLGTATKFRRIYFGADGTLPGGFGYRVEADFANSAVELTDVYLNYKLNKELTVTLGQIKPFWGLEEMTSDLFTSFNERAAFHGAFGFERRVGVSLAYAGKDVVLQGGVFADNAADLNNDSNNSRSFDGRVVFMPKLGDTQLHLGGSAHFRKFNDLTASARYRARPFTRTTDVRLVDTRSFSSTAERSFGLEALVNHGPLHAQAESHWLKSNRPGALADPTFNGGYAELGYFLTGETLGYKGGVLDRTKPAKPLGKGGMGAFQINARYDWLDLSDAAIVGGQQETYGLSFVWIPTEYVRFIANYGHLKLDDAAVLAGGDGDYSANVFGLRAQVDF
jgi:phosphate-selective porin OprO and OprP